MPVQTRSMIKLANEEKLRQQGEFQEIKALSEEDECKEQGGTIDGLNDEIKVIFHHPQHSELIEQTVIMRKIDKCQVLSDEDIQIFKNLPIEFRTYCIDHLKKLTNRHISRVSKLTRENLSTHLRTNLTIKIYRSTENYLKILIATSDEININPIRELKIIAFAKITEFKCALDNSNNYDSVQKKMLNDEFDRFTKVVMNLPV